MTIVERATRNVDPAVVERARKDRVERETAERIAILRHTVFRNAARGGAVETQTNESAAARLLVAAENAADSVLILGILRVAIDNRWSQVVQAGIRYFADNFDDHPVSARIQELWDLTTGRAPV